MKVLVVGGTRFVGHELVWRLLAAGHEVTLFNRGRTPDPFGPRVYAGEVVRFVLTLLGREATFGQAYNVCQQETPTLVEYLGALAEVVGTHAALVPIAREELERAGLDPSAVSPFSGRWMSFLDPTRAREELGFVHRPMLACLHSVVSSLLAHPPTDRPAAYAGRTRERELALRLA